eukprot:CAMPEP_0181469646 /NCGR_PEP_ID=MMETSP1110-20121109/38130_1 /TAXON_ID=174948 /ORGANISM="Symbiodinium sp., Strain CCMP421" /LENGTH=158 /DNA_ID=CAMNT_0023594567 /DNA_START=62 /DNA_END=536 /DNA_ORIENTATION=+
MPSVPMLGWLGKQSQKAATRRVPSASPRKSPTSSPVERCPPEALLPDLSHPCESSDEHEAHKEFGPGLMHATQATQSEQLNQNATHGYQNAWLQPVFRLHAWLPSSRCLCFWAERGSANSAPVKKQKLARMQLVQRSLSGRHAGLAELRAQHEMLQGW